MSEHTEQVKLFAWCKLNEQYYPELELIFAIPNQGSSGKKGMLRQRKMKSEGQKKGIPDIMLPVKNKTYSGIFIEMKVGKNEPTKDQSWWLTKLRQQNFYCTVCYSANEAAKTLLDYLNNI